MSSNDIKSLKLNRNQARKLILEIANRYPQNIFFSKHALAEIKKDNLTTVDIWNVVKSSDAKILDEPELINGSYRYRLGTKRIMVVFAFIEKYHAVIITAWRKL